MRCFASIRHTCTIQLITKKLEIFAVFYVSEAFVEQTMRSQHQDIPKQVVTFFNEINPYIEILPEEFKQNLNEYMYFLAWQITEDNYDDFPDEYFYSIKRKFIEAKSCVMH